MSEKNVPHKNWLRLFLITSFAGLLDSIYLTYHHYKINILHPETESFCSINAVIDCDQVAVSEYSWFLGLPTATWGIFAYLFCLLMIGHAIMISRHKLHEYMSLVYSAVLLMALFTAWEIYASVVLLKTICIMCSLLYLCILIMLISGKRYLGTSFSNIVMTAWKLAWSSILEKSQRPVLFVVLMPLLVSAVVAFTADRKIESYFLKQTEVKSEVFTNSKHLGEQFLAKNKKEAGVVTLPSGLQYKVLKQGKGPKPTPQNRILVHYQGMLVDGTVFDSSYERKSPATFRMGGVIKGMGEALGKMRLNSKWELYIPPHLGYGARGIGEVIPADATLIFQVEILKIR